MWSSTLTRCATPRCCAVGCSLPVACITVLVDVGDARLLVVGSGVAMLLGVLLSVTVLVEVVYRRLMIGGAVAASVGEGLPVGSTVLMLLVVLCPVEMHKCTNAYRAAIIQGLCKGCSTPCCLLSSIFCSLQQCRLVRYVHDCHTESRYIPVQCEGLVYSLATAC